MSFEHAALVVVLSLGLAAGDLIVYDKAETLVDEFNDLPARFGPLFPLDGLHAYPVMSSDTHGCTEIKPPPDDAVHEGARFVVLMARSNCTFFEKVMNAERAGYDAAIVYNTDSDDLIEMSGDSGSVDTRIPSMFIGYYSAMEIKNNYLYDAKMRDFTLVLNRNLPFNINTHLLWPFVGVVVLCFLSMIIVTIVKCVRHRNRVRRDRLPHRELRKLKLIKYNRATCRYETCSICLEDYVEGERLRELPCHHTYHKTCVDPWLTNGKRNCPLCKKKIRYTTNSRRRSSNSSSDSSISSNDTANDRQPLLPPATNEAGNPNRDMGTFPEETANGQEGGDGAIGGFRGFISRIFRRQPSTNAAAADIQHNSPVTVSAVVDMTPPVTPLNAPPATFQAPSFLPHHLPPYSENPPPPPPYTQYPQNQSLTTTPISSPLRRVSVPVQQPNRMGYDQPGTSSSSLGAGTAIPTGTPRIGVAALPNVDFQGGGGGGFMLPPQPAVGYPQQQQQHPTGGRSQRDQSRHNRRRRRGYREV